MILITLSDRNFIDYLDVPFIILKSKIYIIFNYKKIFPNIHAICQTTVLSTFYMLILMTIYTKMLFLQMRELKFMKAFCTKQMSAKELGLRKCKNYRAGKIKAYSKLVCSR